MEGDIIEDLTSPSLPEGGEVPPRTHTLTGTHIHTHSHHVFNFTLHRQVVVIVVSQHKIRDNSTQVCLDRDNLFNVMWLILSLSLIPPPVRLPDCVGDFSDTETAGGL